jgi:hypothetical protein
MLKKWLITALAVFLVVLVVVAVVVPQRLLSRESVMSALEERFKRKVELGTIHISVLPPFRVEGTDLVIHQRDRTDTPPFIRVQRFVARAGLLGLLRRTKIVKEVRLEGLEIHIVPRADAEENKEDEADANDEDGFGELLKKYPFEIQKVFADGTVLRILPKDPGKKPLVWTLKTLQLDSLGATQPFSFKSVLVNAVPPGDITTSGRFGPWNEEDLGLTAVSGNYTFLNADLSHFKGISGILSSFGTYSGVLGELEVHGRTRTPDFALTIANNPVSLETEFHAIVDGTHGDTRLEPVRAMIGGTTLVANGGVIGSVDQEGKTVDLRVDVASGRLEDVLPLAVKGPSPMSGTITFNARLIIPPDDVDIADKLSLSGRFAINAAHFRVPEIQAKMETLSERSRGYNAKEEPSGVKVLSTMEGKFAIGKGVLSISEFSFAVPGGTVLLDGRYLLREDQLDFKGHLVMDAKLSETTSGFKSLLLKLVDPFFRDKGKTSIPIKINGPRDKPSFKLNL